LEIVLRAPRQITSTAGFPLCEDPAHAGETIEAAIRVLIRSGGPKNRADGEEMPGEDHARFC